MVPMILIKVNYLSSRKDVELYVENLWDREVKTKKNITSHRYWKKYTTDAEIESWKRKQIKQ